MKARILLRQLGLPFERVTVDLFPIAVVFNNTSSRVDVDPQRCATNAGR